MSDIKDDFWDIEKLLPKKKSTLSSFSTRAQTVDFTVNGEEARTSEQNKITLLDSQNEAKIETYEVENSFIKSVTITRFPDKYDFYGNFRKAALLYYDFKTPECDFAPFYSYMPQYSQLNSQQKGFYFFWRDCVRKKKYIKTDYSYFYLYVYEILNLPDKIPPQQGLDTLIDLWRSYRRELPNIDGYMTLLVQDYCLVWRLGSPVEKISDFIHEVIGFTELKEFYLADVRNMGEVGVRVMLAHLSDYDWRRGRYAGGDNREIYSRHLLGAMGGLINKLWDNGDIINSQKITTRISRAAFRNSLCTHSVKCRLDIDYLPLIRAEGITRSVTEAVKYTENKLRALLGAKSRLAVRNLPDDYKNVIDSYFDVIFEKVNRERRMAANAHDAVFLLDVPEGIEQQQGISPVLCPFLHGFHHADVVQIRHGRHDGHQDLAVIFNRLQSTAAHIAQLFAGIQHPAAGFLRKIHIVLSIEDHGNRSG